MFILCSFTTKDENFLADPRFHQTVLFPCLKVLFHVRRTSSPNLQISKDRVCILLYIRRSTTDELATSCIIGDSDVCIGEIVLPRRWWDTQVPNVARMISAFFSAFRADSGNSPISSHCDTNDNFLPLQQLPVNDAATYIHQVPLNDETVVHQTLREDQHILLQVPVGTYHPGSRFTVTVQLQSESRLDFFSVK